MVDHLQGVDPQATIQSIQLPTNDSSQQIHMVGGNPVVVFRVLLELAQATSTQTGTSAVQLTENLVGEVSEPHRLLTEVGGCGDRDLRVDWLPQGTIVR